MFYGVPVTVVYYLTESSFAAVVRELAPDVTSYIDSHNLLAFALSFLLIFLYHKIPKWFKKWFANHGVSSAQDLLTLLESFEQPLLYKNQRFSDELAGAIKKNITDKSLIFESITKPEQQIVSIIHSLQAFVETITPGTDIDVRLVKVSSDHKNPEDWYAYAPHNRAPETAIEELMHPNSTLCACIKSKNMIVIPDIVKESGKTMGAKYHMVKEDDSGALICYPVYHAATKTYPFVITVRSKKPGVFQPKNKGLYRWILDQFVTRIQLEYSLVLLKDR
jgi:hypothetical protein